MNLCQPNENFSCGACCGILNLDSDTASLFKILQDRTKKFKTEVDFSKNWTIVAYRQNRENEEIQIKRKDPTTYVCPFLGYIDSKEKKIGCMIHPSITGNPLSQNFSFYGASICQGYDCKNKQNPFLKYWKNFISKLHLDSLEYSKLAGDIVFGDYLHKFLEERGWDFLAFSLEFEDVLLELIQHKLKFGNPHITSFEFNKEQESLSNLENLASYLNITKESNLYKKLEGVKPRSGAQKEKVTS